jgi:hypothetical protein
MKIPPQLPEAISVTRWCSLYNPIAECIIFHDVHLSLFLETFDVALIKKGILVDSQKN